MPADLHLHTNYSDGTFSPEQLVAEAAKQQLTAIALTDHDTVEGCPRAAAAAAAAGIEFIPATELTAEHAGTELHLLGYDLDMANPALRDAMSRFQQVRQDRIRHMVERLNRLNIPLRIETVFELANCRSPGRPHVARALVAQGLCSSLDEAFDRFLKRDRPAWVPKCKVSVEEAIRLIHNAGGIAVLAHPGLSRADPFIESLAESGLDGLECHHTKHTPSMTEHYLSVAHRLSLLVTGGSDCHGLSKGRPLIGTVRVPDEHVRALRSAAARRRQTGLDQAPPTH